jgi:hypothetical protein
MLRLLNSQIPLTQSSLVRAIGKVAPDGEAADGGSIRCQGFNPILLVRSQSVIIETGLARVYGVETRSTDFAMTAGALKRG